ncbi:SDR family oxidoreductase [Eisenibacter elegans]|jgi:3-oxoacyl-[acyl-carrier protein] reductase|uniref:SDR family oxidoreductase n=1 Tax=Eisenibacter elegans TaxID=997 RepID=UPI0004016BF5|nr:SDR family NAD(P)-dependent oxidoreductase [Eisenibacter elegans]
MNLQNARILLTGGSLGIGKATAAMLTAAGAKVLITGRDEARLQAAAAETGAAYVVADIAEPEGIERMFAAVQTQLGGLDVLINNAGTGEFGTLDQIDLASFERVYRTNVFGLALATQKAAEIFKAQSAGNIINIASTAATRGFAHGTVYASSKFALRGMTECWQAELRPHNVRVILINPSEVTTAFAQTSRQERPEEANKLSAKEIAHSIKAALEMDDRGFIKELTVFATNPF